MNIKPRLRKELIPFGPVLRFWWWRCEGGGKIAHLDTPQGAYAAWKIKINPPQRGLT